MKGGFTAAIFIRVRLSSGGSNLLSFSRKSPLGEVFAVAKAHDVLLSWETPEDYLTYLRDTQMPVSKAHHSSMYQDLKRGRPTEIDFMNGAIVAFGSEWGIATPVNQTLTDLIKFRESLSGTTRNPDIHAGST